MSSYLNINELAASPSFRGRVQAAIAIRAADVLGEDVQPPARAAKRLALAEDVLRDPAPKVNAFIWLVVTNPTIAAGGMAAPDSDLEYVVAQAWDRAAGVTTADLTEVVQ